MYQIASTLRKIAIALAVLLVTAGIVFAVYGFLAPPRLIITAPAGSVLTVSDTGSGKQITRQTAAGNVTSLRIAAGGDYTVRISQHDAQELLYVSLSLFQNRNLAFQPAKQASSQSVLARPAFDAVQSGGQFTYFNPVTRAIESTAAPGALVPSSIDPSQSVCGGCETIPQAMQPGAHNQLITEFDNTLFALDGTRYTPLAGLPAQSGQNQSALAANPAQDSFVASVGQTIYSYRSQSAAPQKVATLGKQFDQLAVGGNVAIAYSTRMPQAKQDIKSKYGAFAVDPVVINLTSGAQKKLMDGPLTDASVAPDGTHAIVQRQGQKAAYLMDLTTDTVVYPLEATATAPVWIDAGHFVYGSGATLWEGDLASRSAASIAELPSGNRPTSVTYDPSAKALYVSYYNSESDAGVYQISMP